VYAWVSEKSYIEFHRGRKLRKVSPNFGHGIVEVTLATIFRKLAGRRGAVLTECHFDMSIQLGTKTILVPDVAFIRKERLFGLSDDYLQIPAFSPDIAVEIRAPSDRPGEREWKIETYLQAESALVLDVALKERAIHAFTAAGSTSFSHRETFATDVMPWLRFDVAEAFADLESLTE
jgi:Uma2 family endonuclease